MLKIFLELSTVCNHKCYFCTSSLSKNFIMTTEKFIEILDSAPEEIQELILTPSEGEIFMDPDILSKLEWILNNRKIKLLSFHTNFTAISFQGIEFLKKFQEKKSLLIYISKYGETEDEFLRLTKTKSSQKFFKKYSNNIEYAKKIGLIVTEDYRGENYEFFSEDVPVYIEQKIKELGVCSNQFIIRIFTNLKVAQCICSGSYQNTAPGLIIGDLNNDSLIDILHNPKRYELFKKHVKKDYPDYCLTCPNFGSAKINMTPSIIRQMLVGKHSSEGSKDVNTIENK